MSQNKAFILEFIELYKKFPCLWKIKSEEYRDRNKKNKAYEELLKIYRGIDKDATVHTIKNKIDSMRSSFRRELKKIKDSQRSGAGGDEVYSPHLWYFDHLLFLTDQETPRDSTSNIDNDPNESQLEESDLELMSPISSVPTTDCTADLEENLSSASYSSTPAVLNETIKKSVVLKQKRKLTNNTAQDVLEKVSRQLDTNATCDSFDIIGKNIANKLRELPKETSIVTEKIINDILFESQMGNISRYTKVVLKDTQIESLTTAQITQSTPAQYYSSVQPLAPSLTSSQTSENMSAQYYSSFCSSLPNTNFSHTNRYDS